MDDYEKYKEEQRIIQLIDKEIGGIGCLSYILLMWLLVLTLFFIGLIIELKINILCATFKYAC